MRKYSKHFAAIGLALLIATLVASTLPVQAQSDSDATVVMLPTTGGTTSPAAGTTNYYPNGTTITLTATPDSGYVFSYWVVSGDLTQGHTTTTYTYISDENGTIIAQIPHPSTSGIDSLVFTANPANISCGYGYTYNYQAVFTSSTGVSPTPAPSGTLANATVIVMPTTGGSVSITPQGGSTSAGPGQYSFSNGTVITFNATPDSGYTFKNWVITGDFTQGHTPPSYTYIADENGTIIAQIPLPDTNQIDSLTFTQNPATVTCGYGYTFVYTAIFQSASTTSPSPTQSTSVAPSESPTATVAPTTEAPTASPAPADMTSTYIIIVVVVIIIIIIIIAAAMMRRKPAAAPAKA